MYRRNYPITPTVRGEEKMLLDPNRLMTERQCLLTGLTPLLVLPISIGDMSNGSRVVDSKLVLSRGLKV